MYNIFKNSIKLHIKTNNWQIVHVVEAEWISIYHSRFSPGMFKVVSHSYRPSIHLAISRPRGYNRTLASQSFCSPDYAIYTSTEKVPHAMTSVACLFLALYGDPRHNSHRGRISRINEWTGTCRSVGWAWVCRGNKPPWCGGMPMYSDPDYPYLADKASLPLSSYFPFFFQFSFPAFSWMWKNQNMFWKCKVYLQIHNLFALSRPLWAQPSLSQVGAY